MEDFFSTAILLEPGFWLGTTIFSIISYMIGSINAGQILSMFGDKNLGEEGSKSYGATNAGRTYGPWAFVLIFLFDLLKVFVIVALLTQMKLGGSPSFIYADINFALVFAVVGHVFPIYFLFKGGKGVATSFGYVLSVNWIIGLIAFVIFLATKFINGWTSIASIVGVLTGVILMITTQWMFIDINEVIFSWSLKWTVIPSAVVVGMLVVLKHISNLKEMISGEKPWVKNSQSNNNVKE